MKGRQKKACINGWITKPLCKNHSWITKPLCKSHSRVRIQAVYSLLELFWAAGQEGSELMQRDGPEHLEGQGWRRLWACEHSDTARIFLATVFKWANIPGKVWRHRARVARPSDSPSPPVGAALYLFLRRSCCKTSWEGGEGKQQRIIIASFHLSFTKHDSAEGPFSWNSPDHRLLFSIACWALWDPFLFESCTVCVWTVTSHNE